MIAKTYNEAREFARRALESNAITAANYSLALREIAKDETAAQREREQAGKYPRVSG